MAEARNHEMEVSSITFKRLRELLRYSDLVLNIAHEDDPDMEQSSEVAHCVWVNISCST
jgi:DNA-binding MurR/RpiR family transcriptional regulator